MSNEPQTWQVAIKRRHDDWYWYDYDGVIRQFSSDEIDEECLTQIFGEVYGRIRVIPGPPFVLPAEPQAVQEAEVRLDNLNAVEDVIKGRRPSPPPVDIEELRLALEKALVPDTIPKMVKQLIDDRAQLLAEVREKRNASMARMRCEDCGGWFKIGSLNSASVDPQSAPICDRCIELAASQEREARLRQSLKDLLGGWRAAANVMSDADGDGPYRQSAHEHAKQLEDLLKLTDADIEACLESSVRSAKISGADGDCNSPPPLDIEMLERIAWFLKSSGNENDSEYIHNLAVYLKGVN